MKKLMSWLFYWSYYYMKKWKKKDDSLESAYLLMIWLQGFNFGTMYLILDFHIKKMGNKPDRQYGVG